MTQFNWHFPDRIERCGNFSKKYETIMPRGAHMRIGHHAVVVGFNGIVVVGRIFSEHNLDNPQCAIARTSPHWVSHMRDRKSQIEKVVSALTPDHPMFASVMTDAAREIEHLMTQEIVRKIVDAGLLEDRLEYTESMISEMYNVGDAEAKIIRDELLAEANPETHNERMIREWNESCKKNGVEHI